MNGSQKFAIVSVLVFVLFSTAVFAQEAPVFNKIHLVGKGIAISSTNSTDIHFIQIAVAEANLKALVQRLSQFVTLPAGIPDSVKIGVFHFDNTLYKLKNIVATNDTATADIYLNDTAVGSLNLQSTSRAGRIVWVGTLTLNGNTYNAYILEAGIPASAVPVQNRIKEYCDNNPSQCRNVTAGNAQAIAQFCANHTDNDKCQDVEKAYCRNNLDDARCRGLLVNYCKVNAGAAVCKELCQNNPGICGGQNKQTRVQILPVRLPTASVTTTTTSG